MQRGLFVLSKQGIPGLADYRSGGVLAGGRRCRVACS